MVEFAAFIIPAFFLFYFLLDLTALYRYKNKIHQIAANIPIMTLAKLHKHEASISLDTLKSHLEEVSRDILASFNDNSQKLHNCYLYIKWFVRAKDIVRNKDEQEEGENEGVQFNMIFECEQSQNGFTSKGARNTTLQLPDAKLTTPVIIANIGVEADNVGAAWYDLSAWFSKLLPQKFSEKVKIEMPENFKIQSLNNSN